MSTLTKENSKEAIEFFKRQNIVKEQVAYASSLTREIMNVNKLNDFERLITEHESFISKILGVVPVKDKLFPDFQGGNQKFRCMGGDFILATGDTDAPRYFRTKGFDVVITYEEMLF